jgi:tetratricopeptide (TPR) repeat protein
MWSGSWDRSLDNIFEIQDEIATAVVAQLKITLLGDIPTVEETDPDAYALALQARHFGNLLTPEGWEQSKVLYEQALHIAPDYATAWAGLSRIYVNLTGYNLLPTEEGYQMARESANHALAINPKNAMAYSVLGWIAMHHDGDLAATARHLKHALELEPNNISIIRTSATFSFGLGRLDDAIMLGEFAVAHDPVNPSGYFNLAQHYTLAGRLDEAIESARTALKLSPGMAGAQYFIGEALLRQSQPEAALMAIEQETDDEWRVKGTALALYDLERSTEHEKAFAELRERWGERWPVEIAHVYAWIGNTDAVFHWLEKDVEINRLSGVMIDPFFSLLHADPRWGPLLKKAGVSQDQLDTIEFKVTLPQ